MSSIFRRIFSLAEQLEPNRAAIWDWLLHTPIESLGGRTATELAFAGDGERVVAMLKAALHDHADRPRPYLVGSDKAARHLEPAPPGSI